MQMYGNFEGFPLKVCIVWVGNIMTPVAPVVAPKNGTIGMKTPPKTSG